MYKHRKSIDDAFMARFPGNVNIPYEPARPYCYAIQDEDEILILEKSSGDYEVVVNKAKDGVFLTGTLHILDEIEGEPLVLMNPTERSR
jgi:hypothetical protein